MRRIPLALVAAAALTLAACASDDEPSSSGSEQPTTTAGGSAEGEPAETTEVTVGVIPIVDVAPIYLGVEQGIYEEHGLELNLELAQGGAAIVPGVMSGDYQFGFSNVTSLLLASNQGLPLQMVAPGNSSTGEPGADFAAVVTMPDSGIETAADLAGRTVAVNTLNNIGDSTVREVVSQDGGDGTAVEFVELGFPDMPAQLAGGQIDAAWILEPFLTIAMQQGAVPVSWNYAEVDPDLMIAAYFTSDQYVQENPEVVDAFVAATQESLQYAQANPDETRAVLDSYTEIAPEVRDAIVLPRFEPEINTETVQLLADLASKYGLVDGEVDISELLP